MSRSLELLASLLRRQIAKEIGIISEVTQKRLADLKAAHERVTLDIERHAADLADAQERAALLISAIEATELTISERRNAS